MLYYKVRTCGSSTLKTGNQKKTDIVLIDIHGGTNDLQVPNPSVPLIDVFFPLAQSLIYHSQ